MIVDGLLIVLQSALNILLLPLTVVNVAIDIGESLPVFASFLQVVAYILPWDNLVPLIVLNISIVVLKIGISIVKTIWELIPIM